MPEEKNSSNEVMETYAKLPATPSSRIKLKYLPLAFFPCLRRKITQMKSWKLTLNC